MARNGSGTFVLSDTIAPSTLADANELQAILDDIASEMTNSVAVDGQSTLTAPLKASSGTQALPSWTFGADPDTGIYRIAANEIGISAGDKTIVGITSAAITMTVPLSVPAINVTGTVSAALALLTTANVTATVSAGTILIAGALTVGSAITASGLVSANAGLSVTATVSAGGTIIGAILATQAQQETGTATNVLVTPGRQHFHQSAAKAWVETDSGGGLTASYNVSSVTDGGAGVLSPQWATDFSSTAYCVAPGIIQAQSGSSTTFAIQTNTLAAGSISMQTIRLSDFTAIDVSNTCITAYGDHA